MCILVLCTAADIAKIVETIKIFCLQVNEEHLYTAGESFIKDAILRAH